MDQILFYGYEMLSAFIPFLIVFIIFKNLQKKKGISFSKYHFIIIIAFSIYVIGMYHFTGAGTLYDGLMYQLEIKQDQLNFIPFSNDIDGTAYILNILLFIPFGLLTPLIWRKMDSLVNIIGTGFLLTMLIEVSQLLNNRRNDIDDILLNVLGAVIGFGMFKVLDKCTKSKYQLSDTTIVELPIYILIIFIGRFLLFNEMGLARLLYGF